MKKIKIISFIQDTEDDVIISSGEAELICMASNGLGAIKTGENYLAELYIHTFDDPSFRGDTHETADRIYKIDEYYSYEITGTFVNKKIISCGFELDATFLWDTPEGPPNEKVTVRADRIEIVFRPEDREPNEL